jgi:flagellar basal body-associated protein FliL
VKGAEAGEAGEVIVKMKIKNIYIILIIAVVVLFLLGGAYWYMQNVVKKNENIVEIYENAKKSYGSGEYDKAIKEFSRLLNDSPNKDFEGRFKIYLADSFYFRAEDNDKIKAISLLKEIYEDSSMPSYVKAKALTELASFVVNLNETSYLLISNDVFLKQFLPSEGSTRFKILTVQKGILELSDKVYPNSNAKYTIAGNYYAPLYANKELEINGIPEEEAAKEMQRYIKEADSIKDVSTYAENIILQRLFYKALALNASNRILNNLSHDTIEGVFDELILRELAIPSEDMYSTNVIMNGRFFYAAYLFRNFGQERYSDIVTILAPYKDATADKNRYKLTRDKFKYSMNLQHEDFVKSMSLSLSEISPEFKYFLNTLN